MPKRERSHGDGIYIDAQSPEAMDEMLWVAFFGKRGAQPVTKEFSHPDFERFYTNHIKKLLLVRKASRYLSKGNYHISRMAYLLKLFPDARFIVPVREPTGHVASLMRQHERFIAASQHDEKLTRQMNIAGHFEFGPSRRIIEVGSEEAIRTINDYWAHSHEVEGWSVYWSSIYDFLYRQFETLPDLAAATLIVRFEDLYSDPDRTIPKVFQHAKIEPEAQSLRNWVARVRKPDYYKCPLSEIQKAVVRSLTDEVAELYGYR